MLRSEAVFPFPSQAQLDGRYVRRVGEQVAGVDAFAPPTTIDAPRGTGYSVPSGFIFRVPTMRTAPGEDAIPQEYAEAFRVQEVANASGREVAAWNPSGTVMGGIPTNVDPALLVASDTSARFRRRVVSVNVNDSSQFAAAITLGVRARGTWDTPTAPLNGDWLGLWSGGAYTGSDVATTGEAVFIATENIGAGNYGTRFLLRLGRTGSASVDAWGFFRIPSANIAELVSNQPTLRLIPGATGIVERNNLNTADARFLSADGTIFTLPLTTRMSLPSLPTSPAGLVAGEIWVDTGAGNVLKRV